MQRNATQCSAVHTSFHSAGASARHAVMAALKETVSGATPSADIRCRTDRASAGRPAWGRKELEQEGGNGGERGLSGFAGE